MINKNVIIICILLLPAILSYSQQRKVFGIVKGDDGKPVEFCVIKIGNSDYSTYSNKRGEFSLIYNKDSLNSLFFFCLGYEKTEINISTDTLMIVLKRKVNKLNDVVVSSRYRHGKIKRGIMGKRKLKPYGICTGHIGMEWAIFLQADSTRPGQLENIYYYIVKDGIPDSWFRVHVYGIDTNYMPGKDLLDSNVILHANDGDEWVSVDVSSRHIPVGRSVFISMEWIEGYGNDLTKVTSNKYTAAGQFNGQVLGFTEGYYKEGSILYCRKNINASWKNLMCAGTAKKNILNLMIYATYTYFKK